MVLVRFPPLHPFSVVMEGGEVKGVWSPPQVSQEHAGVAVVAQVVPIETHLSIPKLFREGVAEVPGTLLTEDALALPGGRGDQDFVADGHGWLPLVDSVIIEG